MSEKQFCPKCEYYYSEMFTCPICYGEQKATERIIKLLEDTAIKNGKGTKAIHWHLDKLIALIKGENK